MGLFDDLFGKDKNKSQQAFGLFSFMDEQQKKESKYTDDELNNYELDDWQKEEVISDNYDSWNFEEEQEDDDYYFEDDK